MNKFIEFYKEITECAPVKEKVKEILGETDLSAATDEQLQQLEVIASELKYNITAAEAKEYLQGTIEITDNDLEMAAGGKGDVYCNGGGVIICYNGGGYIQA